MSHYTCLVIGDNPDELLAPFNEQLEDGSPYLEFHIEHTPEETAKLAAEAGETPEVWAKESGFEFVNGAAGWYRNPVAKWDWYSLGGRWTGHLRLKVGADGQLGQPGIQSMDPTYTPPTDEFCDECRFGDLDLAWHEKKAVDQATFEYDRFEAILKEHGPLPKWIEDEARERGIERSNEEGSDWDLLVKAFWSHPTLKAMEADRLLGWVGGGAKNFFKLTREQYIEDARAGALPFWALLIDVSCLNDAALVPAGQKSVWLAPGEMGWFGVSTDTTESRLEFDKVAKSLLAAVKPDALVGLYDLHI